MQGSYESFLGKSDKMGNIYVFGADKGTGLRGMATIDAVLTVKTLKTLFFFVFAGIQHSDNRCEHTVGTKKIFMAAQTGRSTAETVDTTGSITY